MQKGGWKIPNFSFKNHAWENSFSDQNWLNSGFGSGWETLWTESINDTFIALQNKVTKNSNFINGINSATLVIGNLSYTHYVLRATL